MNVLFSPIGNTDPITNCLDGAMLHICRHCNIDKVIMYMSKDICAVHHKDNRYVAMVEKLAALQGRTIECEVIEKPELEDVHIFDFFIDEFNSILSEIEEKHPDDILFLNVSSGTPAMKSALQVLAYYRTRSYNIMQVSGGGYAEQRTLFDIHTAFETDKDNDPDTAPRINRSQNQNLIKQAVKKNISALIDKYDYAGALTTAKGCGIKDKRFLQALEATDLRYKFFLDDAQKMYEEASVDVKIKSDIEEYLLILGIKKDRSDYADFMRAVTPLVYELDKLILKNQCDFDVDNYIYTNGDIDFWDSSKLSNAEQRIYTAYRKIFSDYDGNRIVYSKALNDFIQELSQDDDLKELCRAVRYIEVKRNGTAHRIDGGVSKKYFDNAKPLSKLYKACIYAGAIVIPVDTDENTYRQRLFNEYIVINRKLKELLENC